MNPLKIKRLCFNRIYDYQFSNHCILYVLVINYSNHTNNITDKTAKNIDTSIHEYKVVSPQ